MAPGPELSGWHRQAESSDSCLRRNDVTPAQAGVGDGGWTVRKTSANASGLDEATRHITETRLPRPPTRPLRS